MLQRSVIGKVLWTPPKRGAGPEAWAKPVKDPKHS
jgi:hypothetical protein